MKPIHAAALSFCACAPALAQVQLFSDRAAFLAVPGVQAQPAWPNVGEIPGGAVASFHHGQVTLTTVPPSGSLFIGSGNHPSVGPDWTTLVPGNDIAISGPENLNVDFDQPVTAFGFDFAEPTTATVLYEPCSPGCPCANSVFRVVLRLGGIAAPVAEFDFNRPDNAASFVGVVSDVAFDRAEIREQSGSCDDEYFGRFFTRACEPPTISLHPVAQAVCDGGAATFSVAAQSSGAAPSYRWQWLPPATPGNPPPVWTDLTDGAVAGLGTVAGSGTPQCSMVEILMAAGMSGGLALATARCVVTGPGGCEAVSDGAQLFVDPADIGIQGGLPGRDGVHDNNDFIAFINYFFNADPHADLGRQAGLLGSDGLYDNNDFIAFINLFFAAC